MNSFRARKRCVRISRGLLLWVVVTGLVVLLWRLFVRTNACGVGHCSLLLVRLDNMCVRVEETHRWPHVMKGAASRCPLCDWTGADWEDKRKHAINSHLPQPAPAPLPQRKSGVNAKFVASIPRREHGAKVGGADSLRHERTSAEETKTSHTEECGEGRSGGAERAQEAEAQPLLRGIDSSHRSDAQTAAGKRARHQNTPWWR